eukprot:4382367-Pleurochrysis_carterae.AAC.6
MPRVSQCGYALFSCRVRPFFACRPRLPWRCLDACAALSELGGGSDDEAGDDEDGGSCAPAQQRSARSDLASLPCMACVWLCAHASAQSCSRSPYFYLLTRQDLRSDSALKLQRKSSASFSSCRVHFVNVEQRHCKALRVTLMGSLMAFHSRNHRLCARCLQREACAPRVCQRDHSSRVELLSVRRDVDNADPPNRSPVPHARAAQFGLLTYFGSEFFCVRIPPHLLSLRHASARSCRL